LNFGCHGLKLKMHHEASQFWNRAGLWCLASILTGCVLLLLFRWFPQIDFAASNLFFSQVDCPQPAEGKRCGDFLWASDSFWNFMRETGFHLPRLMMAGVVIYSCWMLMFNKDKSEAELKVLSVTILSALLGPLLIVNLVLKEFWGRPRPDDTQFFGGEFPYVPPGDISSFCESNCSFVSGEASAAFWILVLALLLHQRHRAGFLVVASVVAVGISLLRVGFGRHFISDVVIAAVIVIACITFSAWLVQTAWASRRIAAFTQFSNDRAFGTRR